MTTPWSQEYAWAFYAAACILWLFAGVGLYVALFRDRSRGRRRCPKCWYDMAGVPGLKCPECGREARKERRLHTTRRRWRLATLFALIAVLGFASYRAPHALRNGFFAAVPIPILNFVLSFWKAQAKAEYASREALMMTPTFWAGGVTAPTSTWKDLLASWHSGRLIETGGGGPGSIFPITILTQAGLNARPAIPALRTAAAAGSGSAVDLLHTLAIAGADEAWQELEHIAIYSTDDSNRALAFGLVVRSRGAGQQPTEFWRRCLRQSPHQETRGNAAQKLAKYSMLTRSELTAHLRGTDDAIRCGVIRGLAELGTDAGWALPEMLRGVQSDQSEQVRQASIRHAPRIGSLGDDWHGALVQLMMDPDPGLRRLAAKAAASLETMSPAIITSLMRLIDDLTGFVALDSAATIIRRSESFTLAQLRQAWNVLARFDRDAVIERAITWPSATLAEVAKSDLVALRGIAFDLLVKRADNDPSRIELLLDSLRRDQSTQVRAICAALLGEVTVVDSRITPALVQAGLHDPDRSVRAVALRAAESRRDADTELVAALIEALKDPSSAVVLAAANSLARLGPRAAAAHDALKAAAQHSDDNARDAIGAAIAKTKPSDAP